MSAKEGLIKSNVFYSLSETFDRFEKKSQLEDEMLEESGDQVDGIGIAHSFNGPIREVTEKGQRGIPELGEQMHTGTSFR